MPANQNWARWIWASVSDHLDTELSGLILYYEGQKRAADTQYDLEVRMDGPDLTERSRGEWRAYVEVNLLVNAIMNDTDWHLIDKNIGLAQAALIESIPIFKYGDGVDDNDSFLFCLNLIQDKRNKIEANRFGLISASQELMQASVEGHYEGFLDE